MSYHYIIEGKTWNSLNNAFFYNDDYISNSSNQGGSYGLVYNITKIFNSLFVGILLSFGCKMFVVEIDIDDNYTVI